MTDMAMTECRATSVSDDYVTRTGVAVPVLPPSKDEAPCCNARRDQLGRLPIGYCSPGCVRRPTTPTTGEPPHARA